MLAGRPQSGLGALVEVGSSRGPVEDRDAQLTGFKPSLAADHVPESDKAEREHGQKR
jgi:hypothetical protein